MSTANLSPALTVVNGIPVVSSLDIAKSFGRPHADLMRSVKTAVRHVSESFSQRNFALAEYADAQDKPRPYFILTRDGFSFVVMGFTGPKAAKWKEAYIEAFNAMESALTGRALPSSDEPHAIPPRRTTGAERKPLAIAVNKVIGVNDEGPTRQKYMCFWRTFNAALGINHIDELTVDRLPAARALLELLVNLVTASPGGNNSPAMAAPSVEGLTHREQVMALQDWFGRAQKAFVDVAYTVERKILALAKDADMSGLPAVDRMHVKHMGDNAAHAFRDGMFVLQTASNAVRPVFHILASIVSLGGGKTHRKALTA